MAAVLQFSRTHDQCSGLADGTIAEQDDGSGRTCLGRTLRILIMTTVLVVDDSAVDRRLAAGLLQQNPGWTILPASDGAEAIAIALKSPPDLVVTDLQMPGMDGLSLLAAIRRDLPNVPVILMTAAGSEELAIQALRLGAASYVPKRSLAAELLPTVRRVLTTVTEERSQQSLRSRLVSRQETYRLEPDLGVLMALSRHLRHFIGDAWGLDKTSQLRIGTALEEALLNAYYHGTLEVSSELKDIDRDDFQTVSEQRRLQSPYCDRRIEVRVELHPQDVTLSIRDDGPGFDPTTLPDPLDADNQDRPCGRGVMLMRSFMDEVSFNAAGNEVTMRKRRAE
jgi:CheY-like chemotaxis protein/anti-sigma regulatory factor (Ser/Thr protein kinase)